MVHVIATVILMKLSVLTLALTCRDSEYLVHLKDQVRPFYEFYGHSAHPIARPKWPVSIVANNYNERSTCPWQTYVDVDTNRFPVRLLSATSNATTNLNSIYPCLKHKSSNHREWYERHEGKMCQPIFQIVPVVDLSRYTITNTTITAGYTCAFDE